MDLRRCTMHVYYNGKHTEGYAMQMNELITQFTKFLPVWAQNNAIILSNDDKALGEDLLMALGTLYLSLMFNEKPAMALPPAILSKATPLFAPMLLAILNDIKLESLVIETNGRQEILDNLYHSLYITFKLAAKEV